jgi:hypothetical protein
MIWNIIDRRTRPFRWKSVNVIIEAVEHDNSCPDADQAEKIPAELVIDYDQMDNVSIHEAISWANQQRCPVTLYIYDSDEATTEEHFDAVSSRFKNED